jgi:predicted adenine nucleotide alpha hydrolase (AANH) superfamily ATPase
VRNYDREMLERIAALEGRPRLLLHSCCGPCSSAVLERLAPHFEITVFFYDPNILPEEEFLLRLENQKKLLAAAPFCEGVSLLAPAWDPEPFFRAAAGLEAAPEGGRRCTECFTLRLRETAEEAKRGGFEYFSTTLTVSPHKNAPLINAIGEAEARRTGVLWLPSDHKKRNGYLRSIELSREYGLYRQAWCGCGMPFSAEEASKEV